MAVPAGCTLRPLALEDADAVAALLATAEPVDQTGEHYSAEDLTEFWDTELVDLERDGRLAVGPDGAAVGYVTAIGMSTAGASFSGDYVVDLEGRVHPDWRGRGIGATLLDWQLARGAELHASRHPKLPARLNVLAPATAGGWVALLRRAGLVAERWYLHLRRPLSDLPPTVLGHELVPFGWDRDEEVRRAHNVAFTAHHGSSERDTVAWQVWFTGQRAFRPDLSVLAIGSGTDGENAVLGYVLVYVYAADTAATGVVECYLGQIGVLPAARGRGLASALIVESLRASAAAGCERAALEVDSENATGAPRLYERLGFTEIGRHISWARRLPPVT